MTVYLLCEYGYEGGYVVVLGVFTTEAAAEKAGQENAVGKWGVEPYEVQDE